MSGSSPDDLASVRPLEAGQGWRVSDIVCRAGPRDRVYEEQHAWVSVAAVLAGSFVYRSTLGRAFMVPGSLLLGEQGAGFCCGHEHGVGDRCVAFHFDPAFVEDVASDIPDIGRSRFPTHRLPPARELAPLLSEVRALANGRDGAAEELALRVAGAALRMAHGADLLRVSDKDERRIADALTLINERLVEPLSIADLANEAAMSRHHFLRVFRRVVGETPYSYLLMRRFALAGERLLTTSDGVLEVALACGFGDLSEFTRRFKERFGTSPAAYRKRRAPAPPSPGRARA